MEAAQMVYGVPMISSEGVEFCVPYPVELIVKKKRHGISNVRYEVSDVKGNLFLQVDSSYMTLYRKRVMRNSAGFLSSQFAKRVYKGDGIAEVNYLSRGSFCQGKKDNFRVKVQSGVDYAFIVALIIILGECE
ncbi:hypothetical protein CRYUN_Cryun41cG0001500 [Craigia yunnanensis]